MSSIIETRRLLWAAMAAALAAGALTAVMASGASAPEERVIKLRGFLEKELTIKGSDSADAITINGAPGGTITIIGDHPIDDMRTDCEATMGATTAYCDGASTKTIDLSLADGRDELGFQEDFSGVTVYGRGSGGGDDLDGSDGDDFLDGGDGGDSLRGERGDDELDGDAGRDDCAGGPGHDEIKHCE